MQAVRLQQAADRQLRKEDVNNVSFRFSINPFGSNPYKQLRIIQILRYLSIPRCIQKLDTAVGMSAAVIFVMVLATAVTWPIQTYLLDPNGLGYLQTIVFILIIAALVQFVEIFLKKYMVALYSALGIYLPLITTNCAVLGVTVLNIDEGYNFVESLVNSFGAGLGFMLAMAILPVFVDVWKPVMFRNSFRDFRSFWLLHLS